MRHWDRKSFGFCTLVVGLMVFGGVGVLGRANPTKEGLQQAMAELEEVTDEHFDHPRSAKLRAFVDKAHGQVRELAKGAPEDRRIATVIFRRSLTSKELDALSREYHLAVHEAKLVFSSGTEREFANNIPMQVFWLSPDSLVDTVDRFIAANRVGFAQRAAQLRETSHPQIEEMVAPLERVAKENGPVLTRVGITAKADMLRLVSEEPEVFAVIMDASAERVTILDGMRNQLNGGTAIHDIPDRPVL